MNRVTHAIYARSPLLPGEDENEYRQHHEKWMRALEPVNEAEASVVVAIADLAWKLLRLNAVEMQRTLDALDAAIFKTPECASLRESMTLHEELTRQLLSSSETLDVPSPEEGQLLSILLGPTLEKMGRKEMLPREATRIVQAVNRLIANGEGEEAETAHEEFLNALRHALDALSVFVQQMGTAVENMRVRLATESAFVIDKKSKDIDRWRRQIEEAMRREVELLNALRGAIRDERSVPKSSVLKRVEVSLLS